MAFEVGEVRGGSVRLEEVVVPLGRDAGFEVEAVLINEQSFTKTSNIWGVDNNTNFALQIVAEFQSSATGSNSR